MNKRMISLLLAVALVISLCPVTALAADEQVSASAAVAETTEAAEETTAPSMELVEGPYKTTYALGEKFDPAGMTVVIHAADGSSFTSVDGELLEISREPLTEEGKQEVTAAMGELTLQIPVYVDPELGPCAQKGPLTYRVEKGTAIVTDCENDHSGAVVIPDTLSGCPVTAIGLYAFEGCTEITAVTVPDTVASVSTCAFSGCFGLKEVCIESVAAWCGITFYDVQANPLYYARNLYLDGSLVTALEIPAGVQIVGAFSFYGYDKLKTVSFPSGLRWIEDNAFAWCTGLQNVVIPSGVTSVGEFAFYGCTGMKSLSLPNTVTALVYKSFGGCTGLTDVVIPSKVTSIGDGVFSDCTGLSSVTIPASTTFIGSAAFSQCESLGYVNIPEKVTFIGAEAFYNCKSLRTVCIPYSVEFISMNAFRGCESLTDVYYDDMEAYWEILSAYIQPGNESLTGATLHYEHIHQYSEQTVTEPTCTEGGYTLCTCACGGTRTTDVKAATGHKWGDGEYVAPTTEENGYDIYRCESCEAFYTQEHPGTRMAILEQPASVTADSGETVRFQVEVSGAVVSYRWEYRKIYTWYGTTLSGYKTNTLTVPATGARNGYDYRCVITYKDGTVLYTEPAELTVNTSVTIVGNPSDQTVVLGHKGQFTVAAEGEGVRYQWQYRRKGGTVWMDTAMEGAGKPTVLIETTAARDGYQYRCRITDVAGRTAYSEPATLKVLSFTEHPQERFAGVGETVSFSVATTADSGFTYQWQYRRSDAASWTNTSMTGCNTDTLQAEATLARNGYQYRCVITGAKNSTLASRAATLFVGKEVQVNAPEDVTAGVGETAVFSVNATYAYSYQWKYSTDGGESWRVTSMEGAQTDTLKVPVIASRNGYQYRCFIFGLNGCEYITDPATLTVEK